MLKTVVIPDHNDYVLTLPNEYLNRPIEILVFPVEPNNNDRESPHSLRISMLDRARDEESLDGKLADDEREFWESFGSWQDERPVGTIVEDIYASRSVTDRITSPTLFARPPIAGGKSPCWLLHNFRDSWPCLSIL